MSIYLQTGIVLFVYFLLFFITAIIKKDNSIVDIGWGFGFVLAVWYTFIMSSFSAVNLIVVLLVSLWGVRLGLHILRRKWGKEEDFRYQKWRQNWNNFYLRSFLQIFMLQGALLFIIVYPSVKIIAEDVDSVGILGLAGIAVWATGFLIEMIADRQLRKFIEERSGSEEIMDRGLWRYSRHPNYFGESVVWWGIFLLALDTVGGVLIIASPLLITFLVRFVSGVPLLEKRYEDHENYQKYAEKTSIFFPLPPSD